MRSILSMTLAASVLLAGACAKSNTPDPVAESGAPVAGNTAEAELTPEQLGELAASIEKEPDRASEILTERGLSDAEFEVEIRKVSENPEASKRYADAYKKAKA